MTDAEILEAEILEAVKRAGELNALRKYTGLTLPPRPVFAVSMRVARLMWPDKTAEEIEHMLRANGYIRSDEDE